MVNVIFELHIFEYAVLEADADKVIVGCFTLYEYAGLVFTRILYSRLKKQVIHKIVHHTISSIYLTI